MKTLEACHFILIILVSFEYPCSKVKDDSIRYLNLLTGKINIMYKESHCPLEPFLKTPYLEFKYIGRYDQR